MNIKNRLCVGTVQFGQPYGPQKKNKVLSLNELSKFITYLKKNKIKYLDTALIYNFDERVKDANISLKGFKIITKIQNPKKLNLIMRSKQFFK